MKLVESIRIIRMNSDIRIALSLRTLLSCPCFLGKTRFTALLASRIARQEPALLQDRPKLFLVNLLERPAGGQNKRIQLRHFSRTGNSRCSRETIEGICRSERFLPDHLQGWSRPVLCDWFSVDSQRLLILFPARHRKDSSRGFPSADSAD